LSGAAPSSVEARVLSSKDIPTSPAGWEDFSHSSKCAQVCLAKRVLDAQLGYGVR